MKLTVSQTNALVNFAQTGKFKPADPVESLIALGLVSRTGHKYAEGHRY